MTADAPLLITPDVVASFESLRAAGEANVLNIHEIKKQRSTEVGRMRHMAQMTAQTVKIPGHYDFYVTFSVESGHPGGNVRHMSMSVARDGRVPSPSAVSLVSKFFGFEGELSACDAMWIENLSDGGEAVNIIQLIKQVPSHG